MAAEISPAPDSLTSTVVGDLDQLTQDEIEALRSGSPKIVTVDPYSGDVTDVEVMTEAELEATLEALSPSGPSARSWSTGCASGKPCWHDNPPGNVHYQFTLGVTNGTWDTVRDFYTGDYYAKLCWIPWNSTTKFCMPERNGTKALIQIGMQVTGKRVDLSKTRV
ncbi:hypothetical protein M0722_11070 [Microbacterium sp. KSW4-16]|uniref:hypothetical protein n=1 Tax=Microbacterium aurugineum TaxID=2851642 RepID=UPI0020BDA78F|nr:hypothetical protein [Microbacterium aurugineum]MCK8467735.1 hypothetical protein [Microbacterium aurugineum]